MRFCDVLSVGEGLKPSRFEMSGVQPQEFAPTVFYKFSVRRGDPRGLPNQDFD
jgi:hypothetical protein